MTEKPKASFSGLPVLIAAVLFLGTRELLALNHYFYSA